MSGPPLPQPDRDSLPWWEGLNGHEILLQRCTRCGRLRWPPRESCNDCGGDQYAWEQASGRGRIASWTVTHRAAPGVPTPYVVVLVRIAEQDDIFLPGNYEGPNDGSDLDIDRGVVAGFDQIEADDGATATLLRWRLEG
jgi:hypothetical protein